MFYIYQHLNRHRVYVRAGQRVKAGQKLAYIWGDWRWGHLHFAVLATGEAPRFEDRYQAVLNSNPGDWFVFEVRVENGDYRVKAEVGDAYASSWQRVEIEGVDAGSYELPQGRLEWTPEKTVTVADGRLTLRFRIRDDRTPAGLSELYFVKAK